MKWTAWFHKKVAPSWGQPFTMRGGTEFEVVPAWLMKDLFPAETATRGRMPGAGFTRGQYRRWTKERDRRRKAC